MKVTEWLGFSLRVYRRGYPSRMQRVGYFPAAITRLGNQVQDWFTRFRIRRTNRIPDPLKPNAVVDLSSGFWRAPFVSGKKSSELSNLGMAKYGPA